MFFIGMPSVLDETLKRHLRNALNRRSSVFVAAMQRIDVQREGDPTRQNKTLLWLLCNRT